MGICNCLCFKTWEESLSMNRDKSSSSLSLKSYSALSLKETYIYKKRKNNRV